MIPHEIKKGRKAAAGQEWGAWIATVVIKTHTPLIIIVIVKPLAIMRKKKKICYTAKLVDAITVSKVKNPLITQIKKIH